MKAVTFQAFGPPDALQVEEVAQPVPGPGDVLVAIQAAGVCHHDVLSRAGRIPGERAGRILGHEIAGVVVALGANVATSWLNAPVTVYQRLFCGHCRHCRDGRHDLCRASHVVGRESAGGYAELVCVPEQNLIRIPLGLAFEAAALAVCPIGTSVRAVLGVGETAPGDIVLVVGAGGGLGLHQIQVAKAIDAHVIALTSSQDKLEAIRRAGADDIIVTPDLAFSRDVWRLTDKQGADVVLENVVSGTLHESLRSTAQNARVVVLGNVGVRPVEIDPGLVIARRLRISGSGNATYRDVDRALHLMATGAVRPCIDRVLAFPCAAEAHALVEQRAVAGRVILSGW